MSISIITGDNELSSEVETPLLDDVVHGSVDIYGHPATRSKSGYWKSASFVIAIEVAERFTYYGISSNLITYLTGPLAQSTATAAASVNAWAGTGSLSPLLGGLIADSFCGRYRMIVISTILYALGLVLLSLSATLFSCKTSESGTACYSSKLKILFYFSLYLVAFAQGGHKPCVAAFGADQFDDNDEKERKAKSSFFNWWYFCVCVSVTLGILVLNYIQDNLSWGLAFSIPCILMCLSLIVFLLGIRTYRFSTRIDDSIPILRIGRVFIEAARNSMTVHADKSIEVANGKEAQLKYLGEAPCGEANTYNTGDIEEAKQILRLIPIWITCLGYALVFSQTTTLFTKQGATMNRYITPTFQIPAASLVSVISLTIVVFVPIYDRIFVPIARAITKNSAGISMLQRTGTGLFLSFLTMVIAALVEQKRLATAVESGQVDMPKIPLPISVWWLAPQYLLFGIADVFTLVGLQEFFYEQVSSKWKSIGLALYFSLTGVGGFISSFLISVIERATSRHGHDSWFSDNLNRAHLDYFYWLLAMISAVEFGAFVYFARSYVYRRTGSLR